MRPVYRLLEPFLHPLRRFLIDVICIKLDLIAKRLDAIEKFSYQSTRRFALNCDANEVLIRTEPGCLFCSTNDHQFLFWLAEGNEMEPGIRLLLQKFLQPGDCFVDVGAHFGLHTLTAAKRVGPKGKVIAFEPFEPTKRLLERTILVNGFSSRVEIHQAAVSNMKGSRNLFLGESTVHNSLYPLCANHPTDKIATVPLVRLDDIISDTQKIDLIKIDVEGAEIEVIESAANIIAKNNNVALIVEFGPYHLQRVGISVDDWFGVFARYGLTFQVIHDQSGELKSWEVGALIEKLIREDVVANLFFSRKDSNAWERLVVFN